MKKWFSKKSNIFFIAVLAFALYQQFPVLRNNISQVDKVLSPRKLRVLNQGNNESIIFPPDSRAIAIFWATWCGPCKIEMKRLRNSVESGEISQGSIFAINPFESDIVAEKFQAKENYPFIFLETSTLPTDLGTKVTPTTVYFDKGQIISMSSGMSLWGIWKAEIFLP